MEDYGHVCVLGDGAVGKTSLLAGLSGLDINQLLPNAVQHVQFEVDGKVRSFPFYDIGCGHYEGPTIRTDSISTAYAYILCYSVMNPNTLESIRTKWCEEIGNTGNSNAPIVIVGTKTDLRDEDSEESARLRERLSERGISPLSRREGKVLAKSIGAVHFFEISKDDYTNGILKSSLAEALERIANPQLKKKAKKSCVVL